MFKRLAVVLILLSPSLAWTEEPPGGDVTLETDGTIEEDRGRGLVSNTTLDRYVEEGLRSNLSLMRSRFSYQKSLQALKEARGAFFPTISLSSRYSRAEGGRSIDIPIGDLANPMQDALNTLLANDGLPATFPSNVENESIPLLPEEDQETKLHVTQPILNGRIVRGYRLQKNLTASEEAGLEMYTNQLVGEIKSAYYTYLKTRKIVELYRATRPLLEENLRVSERLFAAQSATEEVVFRSRAELAGLDRELEEAVRDQEVAGGYFNVLLNRPLDAPIEVSGPAENGSETGMTPVRIPCDTLEEHALAHRPEIRRLRFALKAAESGVRLAAAERMPSLTGVFDYGFQGESYRFTSDEEYWAASLVLEWELFDGLRNDARRRQAEHERDALETSLRDLENQIRLQVFRAYRSAGVARRAIESTGERLASEEKTFEIIRRRYENGLVSQIEFIETRTSLTDAKVHNILARYDYLIRLSELEEVSALYER
jgi:outer membrane protein